MSVYPTAQVCVIDDEPREYLPLVHALNALRMGCVLVRGDKVEELPSVPLEHLRLVFMDMHLGTNGGMDDTAVANQAAKVFSRVVSPASAPIAVVVWTKYANLVASFRAALFRAYPEYESGLFFLRIDKPPPRTHIDKEVLKQRVEEELKKLEPLSVLWGWSKLVQRAACNVTAELCRLALKQASLAAGEYEDAARTKMLAALGDVLRSLLHAEAGKALTPENAPATLLNILGPLHADRLEHGPAKTEIETAKVLP